MIQLENLVVIRYRSTDTYHDQLPVSESKYLPPKGFGEEKSTNLYH